MLKSGKKYFYGGYIEDVNGDISIEAVDKILDLIEDYESVVESLEFKGSNNVKGVQ